MEDPNPSRKRPFPDKHDFNDKPSSANKRVRFPKGKKVKSGEVAAVESQNQAIRPTEWKEDPRLVAKERANRRSKMTSELCSEENRGILNDISAAEVNYEDDVNFVDNGIQIEPFNLEKEREEGYFDADGNFVEYVQTNDIKDAWLDNVEVDPRLATIASVTKNNEVDPQVLSSAEVGQVKRRIADLLEPGETVLQALKRLKGTSTKKKEKMPPEIKVLFDQLTEDAVKLMDNGDYNVYHEKQEVFQREAEGYERLAQARGEGTSSSVTGNFDSILGEDLFSDAINPGVATSGLPPGHSDLNGTATEISSGNGADTFDMFAEDDENVTDGINQPSSEALHADSEVGATQTDFVYDESSGYYYSSNLGYYYDASSKLYCCAASGQWYSYNEETGVYEEIHEDAPVS